jgi:hypothetical protein
MSTTRLLAANRADKPFDVVWIGHRPAQRSYGPSFAQTRINRRQTKIPVIAKKEVEPWEFDLFSF